MATPKRVSRIDELIRLTQALRELGACEVTYNGYTVKFPPGYIPTTAVTVEGNTLEDDESPDTSLEARMEKMWGPLKFPGASK